MVVQSTAEHEAAARVARSFPTQLATRCIRPSGERRSGRLQSARGALILCRSTERKRLIIVSMRQQFAARMHRGSSLTLLGSWRVGVCRFIVCVVCVCVASVVCVQRGIVGFERCNIVPAPPTYTRKSRAAARGVDAELSRELAAPRIRLSAFGVAW